MNAKLSEQIESTIEALKFSRTRAVFVTQKMRKLGIHFDAEYTQAEGDIKRLISMLHSMRRVAERKEQAGGHPVDAKLSEQIEAVIDALTLSHTEAKQVKQTMKKQRVSFGLSYDHADDDIAQLIGKMRYMKLLAERREAAEE